MAKRKGLVIAFDGPDGVGKTTQLDLAAEWLASFGYDVYKTRSSGGTPIGEALRKVSRSDHSRSAMTDVYITLAMGQALAEDLEDQLEKGRVCLIDRSPLTHLAYNTYASQLPDRKQGFEAAELMFKAWHIDGLIFYNADQAVVDDRLRARTDKPADYFEKQGSAYQQRVRQGYKAGLELLREKPKLVGTLTQIDASGTVEDIQAATQAFIKSML